MRAIGIGELLWDLLPDGPRLGGAPFNVTAHLAKLGCEVSYITAVGDDDLGARALEEVRRLNVDRSFVQRVSEPTGVVRVHLDGDGVPEFEIVSPAAYEALSAIDSTSVIGEFDILVFGTLAQRWPAVASTTRSLVQAQPDAVRLYDVNFRRGCWSPPLLDELLTLATVVKMNQDEASVVADLLDLDRDCRETMARSLAEAFQLEGVCITRGPDGAALLLNGEYLEAPAIPTDVVDTVGSGDAFAAGLAFGIAAGWSADGVLDLGTRVASLVASRRGAIPDWKPSDLAIEISGTPWTSRGIRAPRPEPQ